MPAPGVYLPLPVNLADEREVAALRRFGHDARALRDLYVQMLLYCKRTLSDGFVPEEQIGLLVYPDPPKIADRDVGRLMEVGLVERAVGGFMVPAYLERNKTRAAVEQQAEAKARAVRLANHKRFHVGRDESSEQCEFCQQDDQCVGQRTDNRKTDALVSPSETTETETETETKKATPRKRGAASDRDSDPDFTAFWEVYPRRKDKEPAWRAWQRAIKRADPKDIIIGAERYRDDPTRNRALIKFTKLPATWLNEDCWTNGEESENNSGGSDELPWWEE